MEAVGGGGGGAAGGEVERKYMRIYEEGINPFKEFQVRAAPGRSAVLLSPALPCASGRGLPRRSAF